MRTTLLAMLLAAGIGLLGTSGVSAAPVSGAAISDAATFGQLIDQVQWHSRRRSHWRGSRGGRHWRHGSRTNRLCHRWQSSRWRRCW